MIINLVCTILFGFIFLYGLTKFSEKLGLLDHPSKYKIHKSPVPYTGGIGISIVFLFFWEGYR